MQRHVLEIFDTRNFISIFFFFMFYVSLHKYTHIFIDRFDLMKSSLRTLHMNLFKTFNQ